MILDPSSLGVIHSETTREDVVPFYRKALDICQHIQSRLIDSKGCLSSMVTPPQFHRFQNIFCTSANLVQLIDGGLSEDALNYYFSAVELAIRPPVESPRYTFRDLVFAICIAIYSTLSHAVSAPESIIHALAVTDISGVPLGLEDPAFNILQAVHAAGDKLVEILYSEGFGVLPTLLLRPDEALRLPMLLFPETLGVLPPICSRSNPRSHPELPLANVRNQAHLMTSTLLISLAKLFQDGLSGVDVPGGKGVPLRISPSLVLLLYYLALALSPSAALYNNVGVVLSGISSTSIRNAHGNPLVLSGPELAKAYYEMGLQLDPTHPHLLTNYGSLLKDQGHITEAIQ